MQKAGIADEAAENRVGHSGHRRKNGRRRDAHVADLDTLRYRRGLSRAAGNRSVPVLTHGIIVIARKLSSCHPERSEGSLPQKIISRGRDSSPTARNKHLSPTA